VPGSERVMTMAAKAVAFARQNQFRIIHVGIAFSEGHPEIPDLNPRFCGSNKTIFSSSALPPWNFTAIFFSGRPRDLGQWPRRRPPMSPHDPLLPVVSVCFAASVQTYFRIAFRGSRFVG
jgi:hypothetical protein